MNRRVAVRGIFVHEGKLLCIWHKPYMNQKVDYWCVIGGGVDPGEGLVDALRREILEETAISPDIGKLRFIQQYADDKTEQLELFYNINNASDYIDVDLSKTTHGKDEIEKIVFLDPSSVRVLPQFLSEEDWTTYDPDGELKYLNYL